MAKFRNKYRAESHRWPQWDYSADALYFLTIVTQHRICHLGDIVTVDGVPCMQLSEFGKIVETEWYKSFDIRKELSLDEFVMMPNHLHAIVAIKQTEEVRRVAPAADVDSPPLDWEMPLDTDGYFDVDGYLRRDGYADGDMWGGNRDGDANGDADRGGDMGWDAFPDTDGRPYLRGRNLAVRLPKSISSFLAGFKSAVNTKINDCIDERRKNGQPTGDVKYNRNNHFFLANYHDRVIRDEREYYRIKKYIINNVYHWAADQLNNGNHG